MPTSFVLRPLNDQHTFSCCVWTRFIFRVLENIDIRQQEDDQKKNAHESFAIEDHLTIHCHIVEEYMWHVCSCSISKHFHWHVSLPTPSISTSSILLFFFYYYYNFSHCARQGNEKWFSNHDHLIFPNRHTIKPWSQFSSVYPSRLSYGATTLSDNCPHHLPTICRCFLAVVVVVVVVVHLCLTYSLKYYHYFTIRLSSLPFQLVCIWAFCKGRLSPSP